VSILGFWLSIAIGIIAGAEIVNQVSDSAQDDDTSDIPKIDDVSEVAGTGAPMPDGEPPEDWDDNNSKKIKVTNPKSINQIQAQINKGQAPKGIIRADKGGNTGKGKTTGKTVEQDHVTFDKKFALNKDGTWKDSNGRKPPILTNKQKKWLLSNGWKLPK
jgi:hypothetical protein